MANMIEKYETRDKVFDVAKGISILLMTITHLALFNNYPTVKAFNEVMLYIFKMPLFIIVSGYLFSRKSTFRDFCSGKFDGLLKPIISIFILTGLILIGYYILTGHNIDYIKSLIIGDVIRYFYPLWFPVSLFIAIILFRLLLFCIPTGGKRINLYLFFILVFGLSLLNQLNFSYFFIIKYYSIIYFIVFLVIGFSIRRRDMKDMLINGYSFSFFLILFAVCVFFRVSLNVKLGLYSNTFGNFFTTLIAAFSGSVVVLNLSKWISKVRGISSVLIHCSKGSFFILAFHIVVERKIVNPLANLIPIGGTVIDIIKFTSVILICISFYRAMFYTRYAKYLFLPLKSFGATPLSFPEYINLKNRFLPKIKTVFKSKYPI